MKDSALRTFLFTDVEHSTRLWEQHPESMQVALRQHDSLLHELLPLYGGRVFKTVGDAFYAVFATPDEALGAARAAQKALATVEWPAETPLRVRMAIHQGRADERNGDFFGPTLNRLSRLTAAAHGGQVFLSEEAVLALPEDLSEQIAGLGTYRFPDLAQPMSVYEWRESGVDTESAGVRRAEPVRSTTNVPQAPNAFFGREAEVAEWPQRLRTERMVTLLGTGGAGKTRLMLELARQSARGFRDGVWLVELGSCRSDAEVVQTARAVLGLGEDVTTPEAVADALQHRRLLLLVDNCEHVLGGVARLLTEVLHQCPHVHVLATSREPLDLPGERCVAVEPLAVPQASSKVRLAELKKLPAVALFTDRAQAAWPEFELSEANAGAVVEICRSLDGIPLALELAASRLKSMPLAQLVRALDDRLRLLGQPGAGLNPRHQTLRATIEWSFALLSDRERVLFSRLGVFEDAASFAAIAAVCAQDGESDWEVLETLGSLVEKNLVVLHSRDAEGRYRMLESIRVFSQEKLAERGELDVLTRKLADWAVNFAEARGQELRTGDQTVPLRQLATEYPVIRQGMEVAVALEGAGGIGLRFANALWRFWIIRGALDDGDTWLARLLALPGSQGVTAERAQALRALSWIRIQCGSLPEVEPLADEAMAIAEKLEDELALATALGVKASIMSRRGQWARSKPIWERIRAIHVKREDKPNAARALQNYGGDLLAMGEYEDAAAVLRQSLAEFEALEDEYGRAWAALSLGQAYEELGRIDEAIALVEMSQKIRQALEDDKGLSHTYLVQATLALRRQDLEAANAALGEAHAIAASMGDREVFADVILTMAQVAAARHDFEEAARLLGRLDRFRGEVELALTVSEQARSEQVEAIASAHLGPRFRELREEGRMLPVALS